MNQPVENPEPETMEDHEYSEKECIARIDAELEELIPDFMEQAKNDLEVMNKALADRDSESLRRIGHSLKGSALMYSLSHMGNMGMTIEEAAKIEDFKKIEEVLEKLKQHMECIQIEYV